MYSMIAMFVILLLQGCVSKETAGDELMQYFNHDLNTEETERFTTANETLQSLTLKEDEENIAVYLYEELLPDLEELITYLEGLEYKSKHVQKLNQIDIDLLKDMYEQYTEVADIFSTGDEKAHLEVEEDLEKFIRCFEKQSDKYFSKRDKLMKKFNLEGTVEYEDGKSNHIMKRKDSSN